MTEKRQGKPAAKNQKREKLPTGRPAKLLIEPESIDHLIKFLRLGAYMEQACAHAGLSNETVLTYIKRGRRELSRRSALHAEVERETHEDRNRVRAIRTEERARRRRRERDDALLRKQEEPYVSFLVSLERAMAEAEHAMLGIVHRAAAGGTVVSRTTRQHADGSTTVSEKVAEPQWQAAAWRLERKHPERWGRKAVDVHVDGAVDVGVVEGSARQKLASILSKYATQASDDKADEEDTGMAE